MTLDRFINWISSAGWYFVTPWATWDAWWWIPKEFTPCPIWSMWLSVKPLPPMWDLTAKKLHIEEGVMTCPNCKHEYPISNGIPNMVRSFLTSWPMLIMDLSTLLAACGTWDWLKMLIRIIPIHTCFKTSLGQIYENGSFGVYHIVLTSKKFPHTWSHHPFTLVTIEVNINTLSMVILRTRFRRRYQS